MLAMKRSGFAKAVICAAGVSSGSIRWALKKRERDLEGEARFGGERRASAALERLDHALAHLVVLRVGLAQHQGVDEAAVRARLMERAQRAAQGKR